MEQCKPLAWGGEDACAAPAANPSDGAFDIVLIRGASKLALLGLLLVGSGGCCSPLHWVPFYLKYEGSTCVVQRGLVDIARHFMGCRLTQDKRVPSALNDVAWRVLVATSWGTVLLKTRSLEVRCESRPGEHCSPRHGLAV